MAAQGQDVRQLLLQVDASVALAQRNLNALHQQVDRQTREMDSQLARPEDALDRLARAFASIDQVVIASANQQKAFGTVIDRVTAQELQAAQAVANLARAMNGLSTPVHVATREQLAAAAAIGAFAQQANQATALHQRHGTSVRGSGMMAAQAGQQFQDFFIQVGGGGSVMMAATMQLSQMGIMLQNAGGGASRFAGILSSPYTAAIMTAATAIGIFLPKLLQSGDATARATNELIKNARETETTRQAQERWKGTVEGLVDASRKLEEQTRHLNETSHEAAGRAFAEAAATLRLTVEKREQTKATLNQAIAEAELQKQRQQQTGERGDMAALGGVGPANEVARLRQQLADLNKADAQTQAALAELGTAKAKLDAEALSSPEGRENRRHEDAVNRITEAYNRSKKSAADYAAQVKALTVAEVEHAQKLERIRAAERTGRTSSSNGGDTQDVSFGNPAPGARPTSGFGNRRHPISGKADFHEGVDLAGGPGRINAPASGVVIRTGRAGGYGNVVWIDHGNGVISELAHLQSSTVKVRDQVEAGQQVGVMGSTGQSTGRHLHWNVRVGANAQGRGGQYVNPGRGKFRIAPGDAAANAADAQARADREAEQLAERQQRERAAFEDELARINEDFLAARRDAVTSAEEQAALEIERITAERDRQNEDYREAQRRSSLNAEIAEAQADELVEANNRRAAERIRAVQIRETERIAREAADIRQAELGSDIEMEQLRSRMLDTAKEQRASALNILDLSYQRQKLALEEIIASKTATDAQKQIARLELSRLETKRRLEQQGIDREFERPGARYVRDLEASLTNDEIGRRIEEEGVAAVRLLEDSIVDATTAALGLKGELGNIVGELIRIAIQRQLIAPLANELFGPADGGGGGGLFGKLLGFGQATAGLFQGGGGIPPGFGPSSLAEGSGPLANIFSGTSVGPGLTYGGPRAGGGDMMPGRWYLTGEKGPEIVVPKAPSVVIPNHAIGGGGDRVVNVYMNGVITNEQFWGEIDSRHNVTVAQGAQLGAAASEAGQQRRMASSFPTSAY